jgi:hypothetical protein
MNNKHQKFLDYVLLSVLITIPLVLLLLPSYFFDIGNSLCLFTNLSGYNCPGCGLTRGIMHLIHFDFETAYSYNMLSFIILPILVTWWFFKTKYYIKKCFKKNKHEPIKSFETIQP